MQAIVRKQAMLVGISSVLHFLVDGLCVCCLYLLSPAADVSRLFGIFLTYNVLAFMTQPFTGIWADRSSHRYRLLLAAIVLLAVAVLLTSWVSYAGQSCGSSVWMWVIASLLGMGNSLFHVWGGKQTVVKMGNDIRAVGVFVSTGAFGLAVGLVFRSWWLLDAFMLAIGLFAALYAFMDHAVERNKTAGESLDRKAGKPISQTFVVVAVILVAAFVMFRSYVGEVFSAGVTKTQALILLMGAVSMLGKMAGGWIAKSFGIVWSMAVVLTAFVVCFIYKDSHMTALLTGLFLINCTMPVTLYLANEVLKGREGLAFGVLAAVLIPGYLLAILQ